jgi:hypothetical protein
MEDLSSIQFDSKVDSTTEFSSHNIVDKSSNFGQKESNELFSRGKVYSNVQMDNNNNNNNNSTLSGINASLPEDINILFVNYARKCEQKKL